VDEFVEAKKDRFRELHREFGDEAERKAEFKILDRNKNVPREEELEQGDVEETNEKIKQRMIENGEAFEVEGDAFLKKLEAGEAVFAESSEEEKWDCETILTTFTNTDNHPGVIKTERRVRPNQKLKIELHKQFKVPIDGLIPLAEEIIVKKEKKL